MLHLITGGAGSGKSTLLSRFIEEDVKHARRCFLIIPEQQANLSERTMLPRLPASAGLTFTITGFTRLYEQVASRFGGLTTAAPDRSLKLILLWQCLRELSPLLEEYGGQDTDEAPDGGLTRLIFQAIEELRISDVSPALLDKVASGLPKDTSLAPKLRDLALLYAMYEARLAAATQSDGADELTRLSRLLEKNNYFSGSNIYIDSFTGFTAEEYAVLGQLLRQADHVTVTLCCDSPSSHNPAYGSVCDTANRLHRLANEAGIPTKLEVLRENHRTSAPELRILERHLWDLSLTENELSVPEEAERGSVTALRCTDIYAEAEATALHILHLVHSGIPYGEIAVVVRDSATYRGVLDAAFERHGIPYYFSDKSALAEKPLSRLLLSALRALSRSFQAQDILTLLKTGLCPIDPADIDLFEQYVDTWNLNGKDFTAEHWTRNPDGYTDRLSPRGAQILDAANRTREAVITPLLALYTALHADDSIPACCRALYEYMERMSLPARCALVAEQELAAGYLKEAGETLRVYDAVVDALTELSLALPDVRCSPDALCAVLTMIFSETELASVPSMHDSVTVGSADLLRVENVSVSFVLGLCEGEFPAALNDSGLLSESDKQTLSARGIHCGSPADLRACDEMMYVLRAFSKPSRQLFISTVARDTDGKEKIPSLAFRRVLFLLPYLKEHVIPFDLSYLPMETPDSTPTPSDTPEEAPAPLPDTDYSPKPPSPFDLSPQTVPTVLPDPLYLTQSRIKTFVQCPYRFYCTYLLDLRERKSAGLDYADSGTFFHYLLERFLRDCMHEDGTLSLPREDEIEALSDGIVNDYLRAMLAASATSASAQARVLHLFCRLRTLALVLLRDILGEFSHSRFLPTAFELRIGGNASGALPAYEIRLRDGATIRLCGVVDRVDRYIKDGKVYLRVVDYKSGYKEFSPEDVRSGLDLQLLIYLFALCRHGTEENAPQPAGMLYLSLKEEHGEPHAVRSGLVLDDVDVLAAMNDEYDKHYLAGVTLKDGTPSGRALTAAQELAGLEQEIRITLCAIGEDMRQGRAARTPSEDACRFCPLRAHCPDKHN